MNLKCILKIEYIFNICAGSEHSVVQGVHCFGNMNFPDIPDIFLTILVQNS